MKVTLSLFLILSVSLTLPAQDYPRSEIDLQKIADDLYGFQDLDLNYQDLYENLLQLYSEPLDLNKATDEQLRFLHILSQEQIMDFQQYRTQYGKLLTVYELQAIPSFDSTTIQKIIPFVTVIDPASTINSNLFKRIREGDTYLVMRYEQILQEKKGFKNDISPENKFKGSPGEYYLRFRSSRPGDYSFGFTAEKDAGEAMTWKPQEDYLAFDYFSVHAQLQNKGRLKNVIVGDYQAQFGQGIMLGGIFGMGKGGETITTARRSNIGFLPYTSAYESGQLRGGAITLEIMKNIYFSGFYSRAKRDASLEFTDDESDVTSLQTTGLHRNEKELEDRKKISEQNFGGVFQFKKNRFDAGLIFNQVDYSKAIDRTETIYNTFYLEGKHNQNAGLYLNYTFRNSAFFTEASKSLDGGYAYVAGVLGNLSPKFDIALLHRHFDRDYYTFYSNAFAEGSKTQNETGTYWGWKYTFNRKLSLSGYGDLFTFPWLKYRSYAPSSGYEWLLRLNVQPTRNITLTLQAREENKVRNLTDDINPVYRTAAGTKNNYLISCQYRISPQLQLKTRFQFSTFSIGGNTTKGMVILQDLRYTFGKIELTGRYALFDTQDYDNRQYVYEDDVWLAYSLPAYYGTGIRNYLLLEYKMNKQISFWMKYAHVRFTDRDEIGSGPDTIAGNVRDDIKFQVRIKF
ncbi:MAG TPA: helix-hairpin-helix domain-containing protein [Ohtaekwangia sp.]